MIIHKLQLFTSKLEAQKKFYNETIGFLIQEENERSFTVKVGTAFLTFVYSPKPVIYHFAFNIPADAEEKALKWLKKRVEVLALDSNEIHDFSNWNAAAIYFTDADGNILEFISRKNLNNPSILPFSYASILNISEIGMPVMNVGKTTILLDQHFGVKKYSLSNSDFGACGDEQGLFIIVNEKTKNWFPTNIPARPAPFVIDFQQGNRIYHFEFPKSFWLL